MLLFVTEIKPGHTVRRRDGSFGEVLVVAGKNGQYLAFFKDKRREFLPGLVTVREECTGIVTAREVDVTLAELDVF